MRMRRGQRGEGKVGCLIGLVVLLIAGLIAYKTIPVKVKAAEMRDIVQDEARSASMQSDKQIVGNILAKAKANNLPIVENQIKVVRSGGYIHIDLDYTVPVKFPGYTYNWNFHHSAENPLF